MRLVTARHASLVLGILLFIPSSLSAQRLAPTFDWNGARVEIADTAGGLVRGGARGGDPAVAPSPQALPEATPTPYVLGGAAIGAFAGGLIGYTSCIGTDQDCSFVLRLAAGTLMGSLLGALFWLGSVPQP